MGKRKCQGEAWAIVNEGVIIFIRNVRIPHWGTNTKVTERENYEIILYNDYFN